MFLLDGFDSVGEFTGHLNEERHGELHEASPPGEFHDGVWSQQVIACVETHSEEFLFTFLDEELQQVLNQLGVLRFLGGFDGISVDLILFGEIQRQIVLLSTSK